MKIHVQFGVIVIFNSLGKYLDILYFKRKENLK